MSAIRALERMLAAGMPLEDALEIARGFEADMIDLLSSTARSLAATGTDAKERKRAADRDRMKAKRAADKSHATSSDKTRDSRTRHSATVAATERDSRSDSPHASAPAQVVIPSLPSLPLEASEEVIPPRKPSVSPPGKPKREKRSRRCPEDWLPNEGHDRLVVELGLTAAAASAELANFRDHEFKDPKTDWDATFRTWLRKSVRHRGQGNGSTTNRSRWSLDRDRKVQNMLEGFVDAADGGRGRQ